MSCGRIKKSFCLLALGVSGLCALPLGSASASVMPDIKVTGPDGVTHDMSVPYNADGHSFGWTRPASSDYNVSLSGNTDPFINWSFGSAVPGPYHVVFSIPVVAGDYSSLKNQASVTISDIGLGLNPTSISNVSIDGEVPAGTSIPAVLLTGDVTDPNGTVNANHAYGPASLTQTFSSPGSMAVALNFTLTSPDGDGSAAFSGQLVLNPSGGVPEPASFALLCLGTMGFIGMGRSLRPRRLA